MSVKIIETILTGLLRLPRIGGLLGRVLSSSHRVMSKAMQRAARKQVRPRHWSNEELRRFSSVLDGDVINVSGWKDEDKEGGHYRDYFGRHASYSISNFFGERGVTGAEGELFIDLESPLPTEYRARYDVAFNHTVLEHVYDIRTAVANICALSRDIVILVTPFLQHVHYEDGSFGDYWRPTPACLERMLGENGYSVIYQSCNDNEWFIVYVFTVASRNPERHLGRLPSARISPDAGVRHFGLIG